MPTGIYIRTKYHKEIMSKTVKKQWKSGKRKRINNSGSFKDGHKPIGNYYKNGHQSMFKGKKRPNISGIKNGKWKGGIRKNSSGYILIYKPKHPFCTKAGCIKRSRFVMEKHLRRYLNKKEVIHHINKIRSDDRIKNLKLFANNKEHMKFHLRLANPKIILPLGI